MYKRRKKITPQASSTMVDNAPSHNSSILSQSSTTSSTSASLTTVAEETSDQAVSPKRSTMPSTIRPSSPRQSQRIVTSLRSQQSPPHSSPRQSQRTVTSQRSQSIVQGDKENDRLSQRSPAKRKRQAEDVLAMMSSPPPRAKKTPRIDKDSSTSESDRLKEFRAVVREAGMDLTMTSFEPNVLHKDQAVFIRDLAKTFSTSNQKVKDFLSSLKVYLESDDIFKAAVSPTKAHEDADHIHGAFQESLIRLLLCIDKIQPELIEVLLEKLAELILPQPDSSRPDDRINWVRLILKTMRYLTNIVNPSNLTKALFDIIHAVPSATLQHEIINSLPDIISDDQREETADELIEIMRKNQAVMSSVLVCLSSISLEGENLQQLQLKLIRSLRKAPLDQMPALIKFIMKDPINPHTDEIINGIRSELTICQVRDTLSTQTQPDHTKTDMLNTLVVVFDELKDALLVSKKLSDVWLKNIAKVKSHKHHKPIDLIMIIMFYSLSTDPVKQKAVENALKSKIKLGYFRDSLIEDTVKAVPSVLDHYFEKLLKLLNSLITSTEVSANKFSSTFLMECFREMGQYNRKMIILELIYTYKALPTNASVILGLLHSLTSKHMEKIEPFFTLIMSLLDFGFDMKISAMRRLMDILCMIAWSESGDMTGLQDELSMVVQKQLRCPESSYFRNGVVCALTLIKHMVALKDGSVNETPDDNSEEIVLNDTSEKAMSILDMVFQGTKSSADAQLLAYDQLSLIILSCVNMDKKFQKKVSLTMQGELQNIFLVATSDFKKENLDPFECSIQFLLDEELEDPILMNLIEVAISDGKKSHQMSSRRGVILPGLVRVIRALELDDLSEIDGLLGCGIALPGPSMYQKFNSHEPYIQKICLDCLFHCCNWFREIVNTFVHLVKENNSSKILSRVRCIVYLQNLIASTLPQAVSYTPPHYYPVEAGSKPLTRCVKRKAAGSSKDNEDEDDNDDTSDVETASVEVGDDFEKSLKQYLREFDFDVCLLLTQTLTIDPQPPVNGSFSPELGPSELLLILEDLHAKLKYCLANEKKPFRGKSATSSGSDHALSASFDYLSTIPLDTIVKNTTKFIPHIMRHLHAIVEYLHNLIRIHDNVRDSPGMFLTGSAELKRCSGTILAILNVYFSWSGLQTEEYIKCFLKAAAKIGGLRLDSSMSITKNDTIKSAIEYLQNLAKCMLDLNSAMNLVDLIATLNSLQNDDEDDNFTADIAGVCKEFLEQKWFDLKGNECKGAAVNQQLGKLLELYYCHSGLNVVLESLTTLTGQIQELARSGRLSSYPHFNKSNLYILTKIAAKSLVTLTKNNLEDKSKGDQLKIWDTCMDCLQQLTGIIKADDSKVHLRHYLKGCLPVLRLFQSHGMTVCSTLFRIESATVSQTIRRLQSVTRHMQTVCNFGKISKDRSLIQQMPGIRGVLETILLTVKNMIIQNKCTDAFVMGSVRNKDHHGEIIHSQESVEPDDSEATGGSEEQRQDESENDLVCEDDDEGSISRIC